MLKSPDKYYYWEVTLKDGTVIDEHNRPKGFDPERARGVREVSFVPKDKSMPKLIWPIPDNTLAIYHILNMAPDPSSSVRTGLTFKVGHKIENVSLGVCYQMPQMIVKGWYEIEGASDA